MVFSKAYLSKNSNEKPYMPLCRTKHLPYRSHQKLPDYPGQPMGMALVTACRYEVNIGVETDAPPLTPLLQDHRW